MANRHFYTVDEYNHLDAANLLGEKYNDRQGRDIVIKLFEQYAKDKNAKYDESEDKSYCDIMQRSNIGNIAIEVKHRFDKCYPTMIIDKVKFDRFEYNLKKGAIQLGITITIWPNGKIWITDVKHYAYTHWGWYNKTTNANDATDGEKEWKEVVHYKPQMRFYLYMFFDEQAKKWVPIIRAQETTVEELEDEWKKENNKSKELF